MNKHVWLGSRIRVEREARGDKSMDLARKLCLSQCHMSHIEVGRKLPHKDVIHRLVWAYELDEDEWLKMLAWEHPSTSLVGWLVRRIDALESELRERKEPSHVAM